MDESLQTCLGITRLTLTMQREHEDGVEFAEVAVLGDIATRTAADDQFPLVHFGGPPDERVLFQHGDGKDDFPDAGGAVFHRVLGQGIEDALDIVADLEGQLDFRHAQRPGLRATGRLGVFPAMRRR